MGSGCFLKNFRLGDCCSDKNIVKNLSDQVLTKDVSPNDENKEKELYSKNDNNKLSGIIKYFNTEEKEILAEYYKQRDKDKIFTRNKDNNKYELMIKRLLEQQTIKMVGPKRRKTIRNDGNKISEMVNQIIKENKEEGLRTTNTKDKDKDKESETITLLNSTSHKKERWSTTIDKSILIHSKIKKNGLNIVKEDV